MCIDNISFAKQIVTNASVTDCHFLLDLGYLLRSAIVTCLEAELLSFSWSFTSGLGFLDNSKLFRVVKTWVRKKIWSIPTFDVYVSFFETQRTLQFSGCLCTPGSHSRNDFMLLLAMSSIVVSLDKWAHMLVGVSVICRPRTSSSYTVYHCRNFTDDTSNNIYCVITTIQDYHQMSKYT